MPTRAPRRRHRRRALSIPLIVLILAVWWLQGGLNESPSLGTESAQANPVTPDWTLSPEATTTIAGLPTRTLRGTVIRIADGDTLTLRDEQGKTQRIRLAEIDAPEKRQPFSTPSRDFLTEQTTGQTVTVHIWETDRYGRQVGTVVVNGVDLNAELVRQGLVWVYRRYLERSELITLEEAARAAQRGLWALPEDQRIPPWQFRFQQRNSS